MKMIAIKRETQKKQRYYSKSQKLSKIPSEITRMRDKTKEISQGEKKEKNKKVQHSSNFKIGRKE